MTANKQGGILEGGGGFLSKLKNREELEGGLHKKRKGKGKKRKKRVIKYLYEA